MARTAATAGNLNLNSAGESLRLAPPAGPRDTASGIMPAITVTKTRRGSVPDGGGGDHDALTESALRLRLATVGQHHDLLFSGSCKTLGYRD